MLKVEMLDQSYKKSKDRKALSPLSASLANTLPKSLPSKLLAKINIPISDSVANDESNALRIATKMNLQFPRILFAGRNSLLVPTKVTAERAWQCFYLSCELR